MKEKFIEVALPLPLEKTFSYSIPQNLRQSVSVGVRVKVPFKDRQMIGFAIKTAKDTKLPYTRPIIAVLDKNPVIDKKMFKLAREISSLFPASLGEVLKSFLPFGLKETTKADVAATETQEVKRSSIEPTLLKLSQKLSKQIKNNIFSLNIIQGFFPQKRKILYIELIKNTLAKGKSCLLLVPDISFIDYLEDFFKGELPEKKVFSFHSNLKNKERNLRWFRAREEEALVIGTQQSVFLPFKNLGLVIVEEEEEASYKQRTLPRVNVKDVAALRAELEKCPCILSSTVASLETFYGAKKNKKVKYFDFSSTQAKIRTEIIDLTRLFTKRFFISKAVEFKILKCLEEKKGVFIFLNRKGHSTYLRCQDCGYLKRCPNCNLPLTYYYSQKKLTCNACLHREELIKLCPKCHKHYLKFGGLGIEKLESELSRTFPQARIKTLTAEKLGPSDFHRTTDDFKNKKIDILISTQLLAKRPHQARADLAVLMLADSNFNIPDFRAGERLFSLIFKIKNLINPRGEFIIQTFVPDVPAIKCAIGDKIEAFYKEELRIRYSLKLPPYNHLIQFKVLSHKKKTSQEIALVLEKFLREKAKGQVKVSEAATCFYSKLKGKYRWYVTISSKNRKKLISLAKYTRNNFKVSSKTRLVIDADPQDLL